MWVGPVGPLWWGWSGSGVWWSEVLDRGPREGLCGWESVGREAEVGQQGREVVEELGGSEPA